MKRFIRKDDEAVSPVIAVILMVAITVVLAGVLYVWVSGLGGPSGGGSPKVSTTNPDEKSGYWMIQITSVSGGSFNINDAKFKMSNANNIRLWTKDISYTNTASITVSASKIYAIPSGTAAPDNGAGGAIADTTSITNYYNCSIAFVDNDNNLKVNEGDVIYIYKNYDRTGTDDITSGYVFELLYKEEMTVKKTL